MANAFASLIPGNGATANTAGSNPFASLIPQKEQEPEESPKNRFSRVTGLDRTALDNLRDIMVGMGNAGQNIDITAKKYLAPKLTPKPINMQETLGPEHSAPYSGLLQGLGQYAPLIAAGPMGILGDTAAGAAYGATQTPENPGIGALVGGGSNLGFGLLNKAMRTANPLISALARSGAGGALGYLVGGYPGAGVGATAGLGLPIIKDRLGLTLQKPGQELLKTISPAETKAAAQAGHEIGTPLSPGEAAARPDITAKEASYGRTGMAAPERVRIGKERIAQQQRAINDLYQKISPNENIVSFDVRKAAKDSIDAMKKERGDAVNEIYKKAHTKRVAPNLIKKLENEDPTISNAIDNVMKDPKYQMEGELLDHPRNSIKVLDYAKRNIDAQIKANTGTPLHPGNDDAVRVLTQSKNKLVKSIDNFSPDYKLARQTYNDMSKPINNVVNSQIGRIAELKDTQLKQASKMIFDPAQTDPNVLRQIKGKVQEQNPGAWDTMVRNEMQRMMLSGANRGNTGVNFFNKVLSNDNRFKQFEIALDHNPTALKQLRNMKTAWENLINIETPKTASGMSKSGVNKARQWLDGIVDTWNELVGGKRQSEALRYMYSPQWTKDFSKIQKIKNRNSKIIMTGHMLGRIILPAAQVARDS